MQMDPAAHAAAVPVRAGIGLRAPHQHEVQALVLPPTIFWQLPVGT